MDDASIILMLEHGWVTKEELSEALGMNERAVRGYIAALNEKLAPFNKCVLSTAACKGYKIPNKHDPEDRALVEHAVAELKSKAVSIFARRKVLDDWLRDYEASQATQQETQLSLF